MGAWYISVQKCKQRSNFIYHYFKPCTTATKRVHLCSLQALAPQMKVFCVIQQTLKQEVTWQVVPILFLGMWCQVQIISRPDADLTRARRKQDQCFQEDKRIGALNLSRAWKQLSHFTHFRPKAVPLQTNLAYFNYITSHCNGWIPCNNIFLAIQYLNFTKRLHRANIVSIGNHTGLVKELIHIFCLQYQCCKSLNFNN